MPAITATLAATAPSFDVDSGDPHFFWITLIGLGLGFVIFIVGACTSNANAIIAGVVIGVLGGVFGMTFDAIAHAEQENAAVADHREEVADWMDDEFNVVVTTDAVERLLDGETVAVTYDDQVTQITFTPAGDGSIAVFNTPSGEPLEAANK